MGGSGVISAPVARRTLLAAGLAVVMLALPGAGTARSLLPYDLSLNVTASPSPALVGQPLTYTVTARNLVGAETAMSVRVLADLPPPQVRFISATTTKGTCIWSGYSSDCIRDSLAGGESAVVQIVVVPIVATTNLPIEFIVMAPGSEGSQGNNRVTVNTVVNPAAADLSLTKTTSSSTALVGGELAYTVTASNAGPSPATGVTISDRLLANQTFVSATASAGGCGLAGTLVNCPVGTVAKGASVTATIRVRLTAKAPAITNTAEVRAVEPDPVPSNNSASATVAVLQGEGGAFGLKATALLLNPAPSPAVSRTTPGTSTASLATVTAGAVTAQQLQVSTQLGPAATVTSSASVGGVILPMSLLTAEHVRATCSASPTGATGSTYVYRLDPGGLPLVNASPAPNTTVPFLVGSLKLNEQILVPGGIIVNGLHVKVPLLGLDLIVAQARCSVIP